MTEVLLRTGNSPVHQIMSATCTYPSSCSITFMTHENKPRWGTGIKGLMIGLATLPQCNQELLLVRDKVGTPPGELG